VKFATRPLPIALLLGLGMPAAPPATAKGQEAPHAAFASADEQAAIVDDLVVGFAQSLAARDSRFLLASAEHRRDVEALTNERRRLAAGLRDARARIAVLEQRTHSLSWVEEPRFREAMIAYRALVARAVQSAGPRELEGWRLLAEGQPEAGLALLRENARLQTEAEREASARIRDALERTMNVAEADRLRTIAIESLKYVGRRRLPVSVGIGDWSNLIQTGNATRADHLVLASLYLADGDEARADELRRIAATRSGPLAGDPRLDDALGAPSALMLEAFATMPDAPDPAIAMAAHVGSLLALRPGYGAEVVREIQAVFADQLTCADREPDPRPNVHIVPGGREIASRCMGTMVRASALATRLFRQPRRSGARQREQSTELTPSDLSIRLAENVAGQVLSALVRGRRSGERMSARLPANMGDLSSLGIDISQPMPDRPDDLAEWAAYREALRPIGELCSRRELPQSWSAPCARISLYGHFIRHTTGPNLAQNEIDAAVAAWEASLTPPTIGDAPGAAPMSAPGVSALDGFVIDIIAELAPRVAARLSAARVEWVLRVGRGEHPQADDDGHFLDEIVSYEEFVRRYDPALPRVQSTTTLHEAFSRVLAERPRAGRSCRAVLDFGSALASRSTSQADLEVLRRLLGQAEACGRIWFAPPIGDLAEEAGPDTYLGRLRSQLSWGGEDVATTRAIANLVAFGELSPTSDFFAIPDRYSFSAYRHLVTELSMNRDFAAAAAAQSILFNTAAALVEADAHYVACELCPGAAWRADIGEAGMTLGRLFREAGANAQASAVYRRLIALGPRASEDRFSLILANMMLGYDALEARRPTEAVPFFASAVDLQRREPQHEITGTGQFEQSLSALASALDAAGRSEEANRVHAELVARLLSGLDRERFNEGLPMATLRAGLEWCAGLRGGDRAWRCSIGFHYELDRRRHRAGVAELVETHGEMLRIGVESHGGRGSACRALAEVQNRDVAHRIAMSLGVRCPARQRS
jgi:hypothetical protein